MYQKVANRLKDFRRKLIYLIFFLFNFDKYILSIAIKQNDQVRVILLDFVIIFFKQRMIFLFKKKHRSYIKSL